MHELVLRVHGEGGSLHGEPILLQGTSELSSYDEAMNPGHEFQNGTWRVKLEWEEGGRRGGTRIGKGSNMAMTYSRSGVFHECSSIDKWQVAVQTHYQSRVVQEV